MKLINKQIFLTELEKFLTFLTDEERQKIIEKMDVLFSAAASEEELSALLVSPQRVTVELSRAYDDGGLDSALEKCTELTGIDESMITVEEVSAPEEIPASDETVGAPAEDAEVEKPSGEAENGIIEEIENAVEGAFEESTDNTESIANENTEEPVPEITEEESSEIKVSEGSTETEDTEPVSESSSEEATKQEENNDSENIKSTENDADISIGDDNDLRIEKKPDVTEKGKIKPFNLILFLIVFIPIGLAGIAVIIAAALIVIAVASAAIFTGVLCMSIAFSGLSLFADIIISVGAALICFGIGIAILWAGLSILISGVSGYVNWIKKLGRKFCFKGGN